MFYISKSGTLALLLAVSLSSCGSDDNNTTEPVALRDFSEQSITDDALLVDYLSNHFYNYEDFPRADDTVVTISIDTISGDNADKTPMIDQVQQLSVPITDANGVVTNHTLYYLVAQQGSELEKNPSIVDSTYVSYRGELLTGTIFDQRNTPIWFDNIRVVSGFRYGLQNFAPGTFSQDADGIISFRDYGQGILFMPSGLGYYSSAQGLIPAYAPIVFTVSVYTSNVADHDNDGVFSIDEDPDGDGNPLNDDTDGDGTPNLLDFDDDGDGILTYLELDVDNDGVIDDTDNDGIPDYLDSDS
ncbi:hypothetical protein N9Q85_01725 [Flavobacteriaceae bacterium]|nr:hypothetical protein [Flavobacteriaceae bacterium]MDB4067050.1 hypothetical protein [Flavobacteriaceae bacterium]MDB4153130.1 hypothetical protein [Flavobacteriaceae bacterium]